MEMFFEVIVIEPETRIADVKQFNNVVQAYSYANELRKRGFEPRVARIYRVKA